MHNLLLMNLKAMNTNLKIKNIAEQYYQNLLNLFEKIETTKNRTRNEFKNIIQHPSDLRETFQAGKPLFRLYLDEIIILSTFFIKQLTIFITRSINVFFVHIIM